MELTFSSDTKQRKSWFTGLSFSHPAKLVLPLQLWLIENYTKPGDVILDCMAGSGTLMVACSMGRHVILVELEQKFVEMQKANWEKVRQKGSQMGYTMGECRILQGDARNLTKLLKGQVDSIVTSPPFGGAESSDNRKTMNDTLHNIGQGSYKLQHYEKGNIANLPYGSIDKIVTSPPYAEIEIVPGRQTVRSEGLSATRPEAGEGYNRTNPSNLANLPYGSIDKIVTSPPYEGSLEEGSRHTKGGIPSRDKKLGQTGTYETLVDSIVTSPPYEGSVSASTGGERDQSSARQREARLKGKGYDPTKYQGGAGRNLEVDFQYSSTNNNIGNTKGQDYLSQMKIVYQNCYAVLKDGGLLILIVKPFIRNKQVVHLGENTRKLCEGVGFSFVEMHHRKLTAMSFWRTIYYAKNPEVEKVDKEYILVFRKMELD